MSITDSDYLDREQSEIKHLALRLYLDAAARILGSTKNLKYIDCCAGPWESRAADRSDTSFGIAVDALKSAAKDLSARGRHPKMACLLIEKDKNSFQALEAYGQAANSESVLIHTRNCDFTTKLPEIARYCSSPNTFPFVFIDPKGWKLAGISQIRPLLQLNPGEVLINLMSPFIGRFVKDDVTDFSDLLGQDFSNLRELSGSELEFEVIRKYSELVRQEGGYKYVCALPVMNPDLDTFNFHLIYATRHPKGVEVFKSVEKRTEEMTHIIRANVQQRRRQDRSGNLELYGPETLYQETRYQQLSRENNDRAKSAVWQMLLAAGSVSYDDCWAEALQLSAVYEDDLRNWIKDWSANGLIEIRGMSAKEKVLKRTAGHSLWLLRHG